jgi:hypothetical protein
MLSTGLDKMTRAGGPWLSPTLHICTTTLPTNLLVVLRGSLHRNQERTLGFQEGNGGIAGTAVTLVVGVGNTTLGKSPTPIEACCAQRGWMRYQRLGLQSGLDLVNPPLPCQLFIVVPARLGSDSLVLLFQEFGC